MLARYNIFYYFLTKSENKTTQYFQADKSYPCFGKKNKAFNLCMKMGKKGKTDNSSYSHTSLPKVMCFQIYLFCFMCMTVLHRQMYVQHMWVILPNECTYTTCVPGSHGCQQRESDLWELALWMVMSYHLSVVNYTQVL